VLLGHSHAFGSFEDRRIHTREADIGVPQNRKERVQNQSNDCGVRTDSANERERNQEAEQRKAWNCLQNAGNRQRNGTQTWMADDEHSHWNSDSRRDSHRNEHKDEMFTRGGENF